MTPFARRATPEKRHANESRAQAWKVAYDALPRPRVFYVLTFGLATLGACGTLEDALALMRTSGPEYSFVGDDRGLVMGVKVPATRYSLARVRDVEARWAAMGRVCA